MRPTRNVQAGAPRWIDRRALLAFFGLTYLISWSIWSFEPSLRHGDPVFVRSIDTLAPYGPTISALILSALLKPGHLPVHRSWSRIVATYDWSIFAIRHLFVTNVSVTEAALEPSNHSARRVDDSDCSPCAGKCVGSLYHCQPLNNL